MVPLVLGRAERLSLSRVGAMAGTTQRRTIAIGTEPVEVELGSAILRFRPPIEVDAGDYLDAAQELQAVETQAAADRSVETAKAVLVELRTYIAKFLMLDSASAFADMSVPMPALKELATVVAEVYGGGRPTGSSAGSAPPSSPPGTGLTAISPSKAQTRKRGR